MSGLQFAITGMRMEPHAAVPLLMAGLSVSQGLDAMPVHTMALRCQVLIEPRGRAYSRNEEARLLDLFGQVPRWASSLHPIVWQHVDRVLPGFDAEGKIELPLTCSSDLDVGPIRYFHALEDGEVPLLFQYSGTVYRQTDHGYAIERIGWHQENRYRMPVSLWYDVMERYHPGTTWLRLSRCTMDELLAYKSKAGLTTMNEVVASLLQGVNA